MCEWWLVETDRGKISIYINKVAVTMAIADRLAGDVDHFESLFQPFHDVLILNVFVCFEFGECLFQ